VTVVCGIDPCSDIGPALFRRTRPAAGHYKGDNDDGDWNPALHVSPPFRLVCARAGDPLAGCSHLRRATYQMLLHLSHTVGFAGWVPEEVSRNRYLGLGFE
jgi:hypothetical protein